MTKDDNNKGDDTTTEKSNDGSDGWSSWEDKTDCSVTCGQGTKSLKRRCLSEDIVKDCKGDNFKLGVPCDKGKCPDGKGLCKVLERNFLQTFLLKFQGAAAPSAQARE